MCRLRHGLDLTDCMEQAQTEQEKAQCAAVHEKAISDCLYTASLPQESDYARIAKECPERNHRGCIPSE